MIKNLFLCSLMSLVATSACVASVKFDHSAIQRGAISESCYHDPCSVAKVMDFQQIERGCNHSLIKLKVVGGSKPWDSKKIEWNNNPHNILITCSLEKPTVQIEDDITVLPINRRDTVPGVLVSTTELYLQACHNFHKDSTEAAIKYGYDVRDY